ncbi:MAG: response regulator transcription factor, partial [Bradymonadaceae bacterium]
RYSLFSLPELEPMGEPRQVLIADDDPHIREVVSFALEEAGFSPLEAADGRETLEMVDEHTPALVILDIMMPEMDGTDVCRKLRGESDVPIVFLSSKDEEVDRIVGLEIGGDDYVTKPFSPRELVARVKAVLRRSGDESETEPAASSSKEPDGRDADEEMLEHGDLRLDLVRFQAYWGDRQIELTKTEFKVLETLIGYPGKVYSRDELMEGAYGGETIVSDRTIDSHVRGIREKFQAHGANPIETVRGLGYKLRDDL